MYAGTDVSLPEENTPIWHTSTHAAGAALDQLLKSSKEAEQSRGEALRCYERSRGSFFSDVSLMSTGTFGALSLMTVPLSMGVSSVFGVAAILSLTHHASVGRGSMREKARFEFLSMRESCKTMLKDLNHLKHSYSKELVEEYILEKCKEKPLHFFDTVVENPVTLSLHEKKIVKIDGNILHMNEINILDYLSSKVHESLKKVKNELHELAEK